MSQSNQQHPSIFFTYSIKPKMYMEHNPTFPMSKMIPMGMPNSGPRERDIIA